MTLHNLMQILFLFLRIQPITERIILNQKYKTSKIKRMETNNATDIIEQSINVNYSINSIQNKTDRFQPKYDQHILNNQENPNQIFEINIDIKRVKNYNIIETKKFVDSTLDTDRKNQDLIKNKNYNYDSLQTYPEFNAINEAKFNK